MNLCGLCLVVVVIGESIAGFGAECDPTRPCKLKGGEELLQCDGYVSHNGMLKINLNVEIGTFKFDWLELRRRSYNGKQCPHTWRVRPGVTIEVIMINKLTNYDPSGRWNDYRLPNTTSLHTHGLHINPLPPSNDPMMEVKPGENHTYRFEILPEQNAGTFWYHAHVHGSMFLQVAGGLAGALIVEDDPDKISAELNAVSCPMNCQHDIVMLFSSQLMTKRYAVVQKAMNDYFRVNNLNTVDGETLEDWMIENVNEITVNGQLHPVLTIARGQMKRIRMIHAGAEATLEIHVVSEEKDVEAFCNVSEIAVDGVYLTKPRPLSHGQSFLMPGNRIDWLLRCDKPGKYNLLSTPFDVHHPSMSGYTRQKALLATIDVVEFGLENSPFPNILPKLPKHLDDLTNVKADRVIVIENGHANRLNRELFTEFEVGRFKLVKGSVVEIQITNTNLVFGHPTHFHVNHFQVISYEPYTGPYVLSHVAGEMFDYRDQKTGMPCFHQYQEYDAAQIDHNVTDPIVNNGHDTRWRRNGNDTLGYHARGEWRDTLFSPALSNITIRMRLHKFSGPMFLYCHTLRHADAGMMMAISIVEKGQDLTGETPGSGNALPGSCNRCDWNPFADVSPDCKDEKEEKSRNDKVYYLGMLLVSSMVILSAAYKLR